MQVIKMHVEIDNMKKKFILSQILFIFVNLFLVLKKSNEINNTYY